MLETALLATLTPIAWISGLLVTARWYYRKVRPSKVPVCGKKETEHGHRHLRRASDFGKTPTCYRRYSDIDTEGEALAVAIFFGVFWPLVVLFTWARSVIMASPPEFPEEREARLRRDIREVESHDSRD